MTFSIRSAGKAHIAMIASSMMFLRIRFRNAKFKFKLIEANPELIKLGNEQHKTGVCLTFAMEMLDMSL